jgi:secreted PhoX family phosphatase
MFIRDIYNYGYIVEITEPTATPVPVKQFTLGRMAHENAVIMPDQKTVYLTDDGTNKAFYKFIADTEGDLSAGTLYAAKLVQDSTADISKAGFDITWIELGSSNNTEIESWIGEYDAIDETDYVDGSTSYITQTEIDTWATGGGADDRYAFLESLRAAEAKGATTEFRKMEGININYDGVANNTIPYMYVAMSAVDSGMSDDAGDIQLEENKCGAVYRMGIQSDFDIVRMDPAVIGADYDATASENRCATDGISNPDNVVVLDDGRVLIGEDTSLHVNNMLWVYNPTGE